METGCAASDQRGPLTSRVGSITTPLTNPSTPSTAKPTNRNGIRRIQTMGYATSARSASGQQSTSRMHQEQKSSHTWKYEDRPRKFEYDGASSTPTVTREEV